MASPVKRYRRSRAELERIQDAIYDVCREQRPLSVRAVFYQLVVRDLVPKSESGYGVAQRETLKMRRAGEVPYHWISDGTRPVYRPDTWDRLGQMLDDAAASYRRALWTDQSVEVIIFSEKDAITGTVLPVTTKWDVELGIARGYTSETFCWSVAEDVARNYRHGKRTFLYQLGDHDPSGVDAWRAFSSRVAAMADVPSGAAIFERLAVTPDQISVYGLPMRPTKAGDKRGHWEGDSVEVDALPATVLRQIIEDAIAQHLDADALELHRVVEESERALLRRIVGDVDEAT